MLPSPRGKGRGRDLSGVFEGVTTGAPISIITYNTDADSSKYDNLRNVFGPVMPTTPTGRKYGHRDHSGRRSFIGAGDVGSRCAGGVARKILGRSGCEVYGFVRESAGSRWRHFDRDQIEQNIVRCPDPVAAER